MPLPKDFDLIEPPQTAILQASYEPLLCAIRAILSSKPFEPQLQAV